MEKLCLSSTRSPSISHPPFLPSFTRARKRVFFPISNPKKSTVFASKDDSNSNIEGNYNSNLNEWDLMELKFGKMIEEDPKLTLAKVMGRKVNPDASFIEIEKSFNKNKGKLVEVKELPFDIPEKLGAKKVASGLNLVKPVPKKGIKVGGVGNNSPLPEIKMPSGSIKNSSPSSNSKSNVPNVILRKPYVFNDNDDADDNSLRMRMKRNLSLSMSTQTVKENFSGMTLLKKPHPSVTEEESEGGNENNEMCESVYSGLTKKPVNDFGVDKENEEQSTATSSSEVLLLEKPNAVLSQNIEGDAPDPLFEGITDVTEDDDEAFRRLEGDLVSNERPLGEGSEIGTRAVSLWPTGNGTT